MENVSRKHKVSTKSKNNINNKSQVEISRVNTLLNAVLSGEILWSCSLSSKLLGLISRYLATWWNNRFYKAKIAINARLSLPKNVNKPKIKAKSNSKKMGSFGETILLPSKYSNVLSDDVPFQCGKK